MARFGWLTRDRIIVLLWMTLGAASLFRGFTRPVPEPVFGIDEFAWLGLGWFVAGFTYWYERRSRQDG
jgi:hypothetical protein